MAQLKLPNLGSFFCLDLSDSKQLAGGKAGVRASQRGAQKQEIQSLQNRSGGKRANALSSLFRQRKEFLMDEGRYAQNLARKIEGEEFLSIPSKQSKPISAR